MEDPSKRIGESLLDLHLERLEGDARSWVEEELRRDRALQAKSERLGRLLEPLDHWRMAPAPANLADKVLSFVGQSARAPAMTPSSSAPLIRIGYGSLGRYREWIAVAACVALLVGVGVPGVRSVRDRAQRAACAGNLASIFQGASAYQEAFAGSLPFAGGLVGASWLPGVRGDAPFASNSRHPYLLVKLNFGPRTKDFICGGRSDVEVMPDDGAESHEDFASARNVSYDSLNLAGTAPNLRPPVSLAYMSDANPLFVGARFNESVDPVRTNSPAHRGQGQTVLTLNGQVQFVKSPIYGRHNDNLWTIGNIRRYQGTESPTQPDDAFLVPGYPSTDPRVSNRR